MMIRAMKKHSVQSDSRRGHALPPLYARLPIRMFLKILVSLKKGGNIGFVYRSSERMRRIADPSDLMTKPIRSYTGEERISRRYIPQRYRVKLVYLSYPIS